MDDDAEHGARPLAASTGPDERVTHLTSGDVRVELVDACTLLTPTQRDRLRAWLEAALSAAGAAAGEVRVRLVADAEMAAAHERYSGIPGTTDVLTFDMRDAAEDLEPGARVMDVDIWACVDEARRQAASRGIELERELLLYALHGVLHCLGYDDHDEAEYEMMHAEEDRILAAIGVGPTFALGAETGATHEP